VDEAYRTLWLTCPQLVEGPSSTTATPSCAHDDQLRCNFLLPRNGWLAVLEIDDANSKEDEGQPLGTFWSVCFHFDLCIEQPIELRWHRFPVLLSPLHWL
jgi:hypothetical protein